MSVVKLQSGRVWNERCGSQKKERVLSAECELWKEYISASTGWNPTKLIPQVLQHSLYLRYKLHQNQTGTTTTAILSREGCSNNNSIQFHSIQFNSVVHFLTRKYNFYILCVPRHNHNHNYNQNPNHNHNHNHNYNHG